MKLPTLFVTFTLFLVSPALAHLGHMGELAGHAHWLGLGAAITAGVLAALLVKGKRKKSDDDEESSEEGETA